MTDDEKVQKVIDYITTDHLESDGGYPYDWMWIGRTLVVAATNPGKDDNATMLETYTRSKLLTWYRRAQKFIESEDGECDLRWALMETA